MGAGFAARRVDLHQLMVLLEPNARREMDKTVVSLGSILDRGRAVVATSYGALAAIHELDVAKEVALKTKEVRQARAAHVREARAAKLAMDERDEDQRRQCPGLCRRKDACRSAAKRQRDRLGTTNENGASPKNDRI